MIFMLPVSLKQLVIFEKKYQMTDYYPPMLPGKFYHVFNRGNNRENLFYNNGNYEYFLRKYDQYLSGLLDTYAFCLLPNHFHMLVRLKEVDEIVVAPGQPKGITFLKGDTFSADAKDENPVSKQFRLFFTSYAMAVNKQRKRTGSLFQKPFKRLLVGSASYFANLVFYIHANPQIHGICEDFRNYPWNSYQRILMNKPSKLRKKDVTTWFRNEQSYLSYHASKPDLDEIRHLMIE